MKRYRGILFIKRDQLARLTGGKNDAVWNVRLEEGNLQVVWSGGRQGRAELRKVRTEAKLDSQLPDPSLAFVADPDGEAVGLLFESSTPAPGLQFVEPHSLVFSMGWLTREGLRQEP
jgi:hypothetical protein